MTSPSLVAGLSNYMPSGSSYLIRYQRRFPEKKVHRSIHTPIHTRETPYNDSLGTARPPSRPTRTSTLPPTAARDLPLTAAPMFARRTRPRPSPFSSVHRRKAIKAGPRTGPPSVLMLVSCCLSSDWGLWRLVVRPVQHPIRGGWGHWDLRSGQLADLEQAANHALLVHALHHLLHS